MHAPNGIDAERVGRWLAANVGSVAPPFRYRLFAGGHSNLTYEVVDAGGRRLVLRRPPLGAVLATAHDVAREHRIVAALDATGVPVPRALGLCADGAVNDAPFLVMEFVEGVVPESADAVEQSVDAAARRPLAAHLIEVLATLHAVDPDAVGLGDLGRREGYLGRQLKRWATQLERSKTRELPILDEVLRMLLADPPRQQRSTIVHGDYRLGNTICSTGRGGLSDDSTGRGGASPSESRTAASPTADGRVAAVLDWELCTLGDPLADLGWLANDWASPEEGAAYPDGRRKPTTAGGFPSREEMVGDYARATGLDVTPLPYYRAFQAWRLAVISEGVRARYLKGVMGGAADTETLGAAVEELAESARSLLVHGGSS